MYYIETENGRVYKCAKCAGVVKHTVFLVIRKSTLMILGCFNERAKAEKFTNGSDNLAIVELEVM